MTLLQYFMQAQLTFTIFLHNILCVDILNDVNQNTDNPRTDGVKQIKSAKLP